MSQYPQYNGGSVQGNQYTQYNYAAYPAQPYQHLNPIDSSTGHEQQQVQYRQIPPSMSHGASYPHNTHLHHPSHDGDNGVPYQDYGNVYAAHDPSMTNSQRYSASLMNNGLPAVIGYPQMPSIQQHMSAPQVPDAPIPLPKPVIPSSRTSMPPAKKARTVTKKTGSNFSKKVEEDDADNQSEDEYNMDGMKTKSGRKVHKPSQFNPSAKTPSKKRGAAATAKKSIAVDSLFCKVCDRGHSPKSNLIVFCDGCNTPYHQLCHVPVIDNLLITLPDAEWFCKTCDRRRAQSKLDMGDTGSRLTEEQKKTYLVSLPTSHLVQLVLYANQQNPDLGLFSPKAAEVLEANQKKREAAMAMEQAKLTIPVYQAVPGDDIPRAPDDVLLEKKIIRALKGLQESLAKHSNTSISQSYTPREIFDWVEANEIVDPSTFRVACAQQLQKSYASGRLHKDGSGYSVNESSVAPVLTSVQSVPGDSQASHGDKLGSRNTGGVSLSANAASALMQDEEQYPEIEGIKLPAESVADGFAMHEDESPAFTHTINYGQR